MTYLIIQAQTSKHLQRGGSNAALVGTRILENDNTSLLQVYSGLLSQEKIGALDDVFVMARPVLVEKLRNVGDIDGFWTATARNEKVSLEPEVCVVTEVGPVGNYLSRG